MIEGLVKIGSLSTVSLRKCIHDKCNCDIYLMLRMCKKHAFKFWSVNLRSSIIFWLGVGRRFNVLRVKGGIYKCCLSYFDKNLSSECKIREF